MAGIHPVVMPKWGLAMTEGTIVGWHADEGARVEAGDDLLDIETTKITNVVESPRAGVLRRQVAADGATLPVGALLAVFAEPGVADEEIDAFVADFNANFVAEAAEAEATAPTAQILDARGTAINALRMGSEPGPPIVMIHGFGGDLNNWMFNQPMLAERHTVIALDLPGHGRSIKDVGVGDPAAMTATLIAALDALDVERAHLVGHSMGGAFALSMALTVPERVASVTALAPGGLGPEINMQFIEGFIRASRRKDMKGVLANLFADPELVSRDMIEDVLKYKRLDGVERALTALAASLFPGGRQAHPLAHRLHEATAPIQVVWGTEDKIIPVSHAENLPASIAVHKLAGTGHMPHMERASEVNALIEAFAAQA